MLMRHCPYGPVQDLSVINETNAYCWVDIVVRPTPAQMLVIPVLFDKVQSVVCKDTSCA